MRIVVASAQTPFRQDPTAKVVEELVHALRHAGHSADAAHFPFNPDDPERIPDQMLACRLIDLAEIDGTATDRLIAVNFPAYLLPHRHKVLLLLELFSPAYADWDRSLGNLVSHPHGKIVRDIIHRADRSVAAEARAIFTVSEELAERAQRLWQVSATCLGTAADPPQGAPALLWNANTIERLLA